MIDKLEAAVKELTANTLATRDPADAMRYSQAALNLANTIATLKHSGTC